MYNGFRPTKQFAYQEQTVLERAADDGDAGVDLGTSQRIYSVVTAVETMKFNASNLHANPDVVN
ncbi:hypothetical protein K0M31_012967 [Melipona bicolor]|uniref:Uncharacterized protein n=1 Tax=Melipona bicolor TaxID=60889 RepID=A0AA40FIV2_9HYME|nr:hypothetical protein K0M31_012967 [Melipona bicolor]